MSDPAEGVKDLLVAAEIGTFGASTGWGIFIGKLPTSPNSAIATVMTGGTPPNPKYLLDYPSVQVLVRGDVSGYQAARAKAQAVKDVLLGLPSQAVNGDQWDIVNMIGDIAFIGFDGNNCPIFSLNFSLTIEPATGDATNRIPL